MIEDHVKRNVVRVPAAGASGRGAYFRQVRRGPQFQVVFFVLVCAGGVSATSHVTA